MKTMLPIKVNDLAKSVRKPLPPPSKAFKDKRGKDCRKAWKKEVW